MTNVLVTGAAGFVGRNLVAALERLEHVAVTKFTSADAKPVLEAALLQADVIFHLAGVNRPETVEQFATGNAGLTREIDKKKKQQQRTPKIVLPSSIQADQLYP